LKSWEKNLGPEELWKTLEDEGNGIYQSQAIDIIEIMGPYGTSLAKTENFSTHWQLNGDRIVPS
jgi:hypothetical protein